MTLSAFVHSLSKEFMGNFSNLSSELKDMQLRRSYESRKEAPAELSAAEAFKEEDNYERSTQRSS